MNENKFSLNFLEISQLPYSCFSLSYLTQPKPALCLILLSQFRCHILYNLTLALRQIPSKSFPSGLPQVHISGEDLDTKSIPSGLPQVHISGEDLDTKSIPSGLPQVHIPGEDLETKSFPSGVPQVHISGEDLDRIPR